MSSSFSASPPMSAACSWLPCAHQGAAVTLCPWGHEGGIGVLGRVLYLLLRGTLGTCVGPHGPWEDHSAQGSAVWKAKDATTGQRKLWETICFCTEAPALTVCTVPPELCSRSERKSYVETSLHGRRLLAGHSELRRWLFLHKQFRGNNSKGQFLLLNC